MNDHVMLLSIPGLRSQDLDRMPHLAGLTASGDRASLVPSFPAVTWPVQANMLTGKLAEEHGVVANGFYWRDRQKVEMWTAWNDRITAPQIWDIMHQHDTRLTSAVWFPMLSKGCGADYVCMPAPIHNPDGSESLWCYTTPTEMYGTLRDEFGHFPLQHFWGPMANVKSSDWIARSAVHAALAYRPHFFYIYLPHLDYAAQRNGPDSPQAAKSVEELDAVIGQLISGMENAYSGVNLLWLAASEYTIVPVDHVTYPNRVLREAGLLKVNKGTDGEQLDTASSQAWALVDHQLSHVFVSGEDAQLTARIADLFRGRNGIAEVLVGDERDRYGLVHERSGEVVLVSDPNSWQAYYWWLDEVDAPTYARTVDIHRKPGYDPVELHFDPTAKSIPLDASLVRGSHGAPALSEEQRGVLLSSGRGVFVEQPLADTDVAGIVLRQFGIYDQA